MNQATKRKRRAAAAAPAAAAPAAAAAAAAAMLLQEVVQGATAAAAAMPVKVRGSGSGSGSKITAAYLVFSNPGAAASYIIRSDRWFIGHTADGVGCAIGSQSGKEGWPYWHAPGNSKAFNSLQEARVAMAGKPPIKAHAPIPEDTAALLAAAIERATKRAAIMLQAGIRVVDRKAACAAYGRGERFIT